MRVNILHGVKYIRVATEYQEETRETETLVVECAYLRREISN